MDEATKKPTDEELNQLLSAPIQVQAQFIKDLSFENPRLIEVLTKGLQTPPQLAVNIEVQASALAENHFEVTLNTQVKAYAPTTEVSGDSAPVKPVETSSIDKQEVVFLIEIAYGGIFKLPKLSDDLLRPLLLIECPRLLFPFVRSIVADITRESGLPPVILAPVNFIDLYEQGQRQSKAEILK